MNTDKTSNLHELEADISFHRNIPKRWRKCFVDIFKEQAASIEEPEEIQDIIDAWSWFRKLDPWMLITLQMFAQSPASTPYFLSVDYLFDQGVESEHQTKKDLQKLNSRFRRACHKLYRAGMLRGVTVKPEEVGPGRRSVTIWLAPFARDKDVEPVRKFYVQLTEGRMISNKQAKKQPNELTLHNRKMKVMSILDNYKEHPNWYDYYKCSKKHEEGLESHKKIKSRYKKKKYLLKCKDCQRDLIEIPFEEFMEHKKKQLYKKWGIKE
jgi:hypothetical protein